MSAFSRLSALIVLAYLFGFGWFVGSMPGRAPDRQSDAVVVLTGGEGRIGHGLSVLRLGKAPRLFVAGVDPKVRPREFAAQYKVPVALMRCCVTLDFRSTDTITNAEEVAEWIRREKLHSVRLVTSDWHMRRAAMELRRTAPDDTVILRDAVPTNPSFQILVLEYNKLLARSVRLGGH